MGEVPKNVSSFSEDQNGKDLSNRHLELAKSEAVYANINRR